MSTYAYRWADGTVSVCSARNKDEAAFLFDEVGPVSRRLIIRLNSNLMITVSPDIDHSWVFDDGPRLGELISLELVERCYPHYDKVLGEIFDLLSERHDSLHRHPELRRKIEKALERDIEDTRKRMASTPETLDTILFYPKGLPGQNN